MTGFGTTSADSDAPSSRLLTVNVNILTNFECRAKNTIYSGKVDSNMICAGVAQGENIFDIFDIFDNIFAQGGKDACKRDSGGPLVAQLGGRANLVGVVSWGQGCAEASYPGVYTRVASFRSWIDKQVAAGRKCRY